MNKVKGVVTDSRFILNNGKFFLKINIGYISIGGIFYFIDDIKKIEKLINQYYDENNIFPTLNKKDDPESLIGSEVDGIHYHSKGEVKLVKIGDVFANL